MHTHVDTNKNGTRYWPESRFSENLYISIREKHKKKTGKTLETRNFPELKNKLKHW